MMSDNNSHNNIKDLYGLVSDKKDFIIKVSAAFKRRPNSVSNHWFCGYFSVPEAIEDEVISFMQAYVASQNVEQSKSA